VKILHTSDWHLGHRLLEHSQYEEQVLFLKWLRKYIYNNKIDILLVSGDIFDTGMPSSLSQELYYNFLVQLTQTGCKHIVITGGNHDSPGTINAPKELLNALSIYVVGKTTENIKEEVFKLTVGNDDIVIAAVPYLRDQDIRRAVAGESFEQIGDRYKKALINHYNDVAEYCNELKTEKSITIAMGHLFVVGGSSSDSEQSIYVGNLGDIGVDDFDSSFDYIALGHLHRAQKIKKDIVRYSGSPYVLSFSEINTNKKVVVVETNKANIKNIEEVNIPKFRDFFRIKGTVEECVDKLKNIIVKESVLTPWVEVVLKNSTTIDNSIINKTSEALSLEVIKITLADDKKEEDLEDLVKKSKNIKELTPIEVFNMKCKEVDFDIKDRQDVLDAFNEALNIAMDEG